MRHRRSAAVLVLLIGLTLSLALPGGATPAQPRQSAADGDTAAFAIGFVQEEAERYGVSAADVADLRVLSHYTSRHNGVTHVSVGQLFEGREVFGSQATVNIAADGSVLYVGENLVAGLTRGGSGNADSDAAEAVAAAADALNIQAPQGLRTLGRSADASGEVLLSDGGISEEPIPARLGWQPTEAGLRLAWQVTIDEASESHLWNATVDAETGELLNVDDWTDHHTVEDLAHLARGEAGSSAASALVSNHHPPVPAEDGSTYRVFEIPMESPNDGPRRLVENPADALSSPFGWHDTDGATGAEFTTTRGNNAHAYLDQDSNNQPDFGQDVDGGPGLDFDFDADLSEHSQAYRDAVVTNLFYFNNIIHDVLYRYGFDEVAGNFQANKYGATLPNGDPVPGGDYVRAEAADGSGTNNANFSTPANYGGAPRMQMYLWPGNQLGAQNQVVVGETSFGAAWARFGPPASNAGVAGQVVVAAANGCNAADYAPPSSGSWIAVTTGVTTGATGCANPQRTAVAEGLGAAAIIIANTNTSATPAVLTGSQAGPAAPVGIPAVSVNQADANAIRAAAGQVATVRKSPAHPGIRDGDFDNGIIIHEYGHGISNRLTGGPGTNCLSGDERMSEGWSDYYAMTMLIDPALDDPELPRGLVPYALFQPDRHGNGLRPRPYTRDMNVQPFTYDRIKTNGWITGGSLALPHGVGHAWTSILWDMTWDLIERHGFHDNLYDAWDSGGNTRSMQYVTDGLKIQGCGPGFVVGRDAILAADMALTGDPATDTPGEDSCLIWSAFARRGVGYSAVQGTTNRNDNTEAFDVPPFCKAPGRGFVGPQLANAPALNTREAGSTTPVFFNIAGHPYNGRLDALKPGHSPSSQQIDCTTLAPLQYAITEPTDTAGGSSLTYNAQQNRYQYNWQAEDGWVDTCRQLIITLEDGTQHRANFRFIEPE